MARILAYRVHTTGAPVTERARWTIGDPDRRMASADLLHVVLEVEVRVGVVVHLPLSFELLG